MDSDDYVGTFLWLTGNWLSSKNGPSELKELLPVRNIYISMNGGSNKPEILSSYYPGTWMTITLLFRHLCFWINQYNYHSFGKWLKCYLEY